MGVRHPGQRERGRTTDSPAGKYLQSLGVAPKDFNSYGSRRGNDLVMARGTFANIRLKNNLVAPKEGNWTKFFDGGPQTADRRPKTTDGGQRSSVVGLRSNVAKSKICNT